MQNQQRESPKITVAIRKRPISKKELQRNQTDIVRIQEPGTVVVSEYKQKVDLTKYIEETTFHFDHAFNEQATNQEIYQLSIQPLIESAFRGAKISCFAYGQTGSGKTYTMRGDLQKGVPGLYYLAASEIFHYLQHPDFSNLSTNVSFFEIYCGKLYDLLNNRAELKIREDKKQNINVIGLEEKIIQSAQEFMDVIEYGSNFRITSQNATNAQSSRSHAILQITLKDGKKMFSKISLIDLAGNERGADHMDQNKQTKIDGAEISKSLLALKQCIRALDQGNRHVPFRGSKLTMVLKDSFVGFCKTVMIGNVSPNVSSSENTMNTLRYADRVKQLKNQNDTPLSKEEQLAKEMMLPRANKNSLKISINPNDDPEDIEIKKEAARKKHKNQKPESDMDIEAPVNLPPRRKTDFLGTDNQKQVKNERRTMIPKISHQNHDENLPKNKNHFSTKSHKQIKGSETKAKGSLESGQNHLNTYNRQPNPNPPPPHPTSFPKIYQPVENTQQSLEALLQDVEIMKGQFLNDHKQVMKDQSMIIKHEAEMSDKYQRYHNTNDLTYVQGVQAALGKKLEILTNLKEKADYLANKMIQSSELDRILGENQLPDEQLLDGIEFGGRLF